MIDYKADPYWTYMNKKQRKYLRLLMRQEGKKLRFGRLRGATERKQNLQLFKREALETTNV